ncbi:hypothetical protein [Caulobacter segnis]|uniref:Uncharacterized protein n=1 Tax=Caulobacter segnis TaxID=88688 RepID=A0A2W5V3B2_9CAUL|nr:hypothetical protein [Caulobacter segnis]PZR34300.1 MAG: hypothetical protein DI526_10830 [Caulobacter segnis]
MPTYLFYPRRANGVSLTFIAETAENDREAMELAVEIAADHDCVSVFVWEPAASTEGRDRFVGEAGNLGGEARAEASFDGGASAEA